MTPPLEHCLHTAKNNQHQISIPRSVLLFSPLLFYRLPPRSTSITSQTCSAKFVLPAVFYLR